MNVKQRDIAVNDAKVYLEESRHITDKGRDVIENLLSELEATERKLAEAEKWKADIKAVKDFDLDRWLDWDAEVKKLEKVVEAVKECKQFSWYEGVMGQGMNVARVDNLIEKLSDYEASKG